MEGKNTKTEAPNFNEIAKLKVKSSGHRLAIEKRPFHTQSIHKC